MDVKAIFFDVDGTLISHTTGKVSDQTRKALHVLHKKGVKLFLATGRHVPELEDLQIIDLPFDGYVLLNGQLCLDGSRKIIHDHPIEDPDRSVLVSLFNKKEFPLIIVNQEKLYANLHNEIIQKAQDDISSPVPPVEAYKGEPVYQFIAYVDTNTVKKLSDALPSCQITRWNPYGVDIISSSGGKAKGIKEMLNYYRIPLEATMAFGDGENDLEMLKLVHTGIAMGNADSSVKKAADHITTSDDRDGIVDALIHFQILQTDEI